MEQPQNTISSTTTLAALAGILFFGPFIARTKNSSSRQNGERISRDDFFILGYCKVGTLNLTLFIITFIIFIADYRFPSPIFDWIITLITGIICTVSLVSILACLHNVPLFDTPPSNETLPKTDGTPILHKPMILKSFLPFYNLKLRYQTANFQTPYWWLKESVLWRTVFSFLTLLLGIQIGTTFLALIVIRVLLLLINIDMLPNNLKRFLNHGFLMHPEEIIGKITKKRGYLEMPESHINTALQYLTFAILLRLIRRKVNLDYTLIIPALALCSLIINILFTYRKYHKFPNIPLLYEMRSLVIK